MRRNVVPEAELGRLFSYLTLGDTHGGAHDEKRRADRYCEIAARMTEADISAYYRFPKKKNTAKNAANDSQRAIRLNFMAKRGGEEVPQRLSAEDPHVEILATLRRAVVQLTPEGPFPQMLIVPSARSALAVYIESSATERGVLVLNSRTPYYFNGAHLGLMEALADWINSKRGAHNG
jgi:hypothetical protein